MKHLFNQLKKKQGYDNRHKMCPHCGRFVSEGDTKCSYCDGNIGHIRVSKTRGSMQSDGRLETVMTAAGICILFYMIQAMKSHELMGYILELPGVPDIQFPEGSLFSAYLNPSTVVSIFAGSIVVPNALGTEVWRNLQYMFLHGGPFHLFFNLSALSYLGIQIKEYFGIRRFWVLLVVSGFVGGLCNALVSYWQSDYPGNTVGISGAIFGLAGALYSYYRATGDVLLADKYKKFLVFINILFIVVSMIGVPIANSAHLGGMFTGMALGYLMHIKSSWKLLQVFEQVALIALAVLWFYGLYRVALNLSDLDASFRYYQSTFLLFS
ncbi:MAG: hypothetical protein CR997_11895 [Acidobacteria bacterium]|nr:MAG: hypothetical protein CR997_11895 [Acidobacteriota bacterium]